MTSISQMARLTGGRVATGAKPSEYDHDAEALALHWVIQATDDEGIPIPCRGHDMTGTDVPLMLIVSLCGSCPLALRTACGRYGIAVLRSTRGKHAGVWGGALLVNVADAARLEAELDAAEVVEAVENSAHEPVDNSSPLSAAVPRGVLDPAPKDHLVPVS